MFSFRPQNPPKSHFWKKRIEVRLDHDGPYVTIMLSNGFFGKIHYADLFAYLHWGRLSLRAAKHRAGLARRVKAFGVIRDANKDYYIKKPIKPISQESAAIVLRDDSMILKEQMDIVIRGDEKIQFTFSKKASFHLDFEGTSLLLKRMRIVARVAKNAQGDTNIYSTTAELVEEAEDNFRSGKQHF